LVSNTETFNSFKLLEFSRLEKRRNAYRVLVERSGGKKPLGRPKRECDDIKMDHKKYDELDRSSSG
jgi:hypothetical protein